MKRSSSELKLWNLLAKDVVWSINTDNVKGELNNIMENNSMATNYKHMLLQNQRKDSQFMSH